MRIDTTSGHPQQLDRRSAKMLHGFLLAGLVILALTFEVCLRLLGHPVLGEGGAGIGVSDSWPSPQ